MQTNLITSLGKNLDLHIKIFSLNDFNRVILLAKYVKDSTTLMQRKTRLNHLENILIAYNYKYKIKEKVFFDSL